MGGHPYGLMHMFDPTPIGVVFSFIGLIFFVLSFICLGGANDAYEKFPDGKIVTMNSSSSLESLISLSSQPLSEVIFLEELDVLRGEETEETEEKEEREEVPVEQEVQGTEEKEEGEEVPVEQGTEEKEEGEEVPVEQEVQVQGTRVMFLWHFTSAAVCFCISTYFMSMLFISWCFNPSVALGVCLVPMTIAALLAVPPAVRMDAFTTASYWLFFIPDFLVVLVVLVCAIVFCAKRAELNSSCCGHTSLLVVGVLLFLAWLGLFILRLEGVLPPSWRYTYLFIIPFFAVLVAATSFLPAFGAVADNTWSCDEPNCFTSGTAVTFVVVVVVYSVFFLPFCLRKDQFFHTSYHFPLIPFHIISLIVLLILICIIPVAVREYSSSA